MPQTLNEIPQIPKFLVSADHNKYFLQWVLKANEVMGNYQVLLEAALKKIQK